MEKPGPGKVVAREAAVIASCGAIAFGIWRFIPGIGKDFLFIKIAAMLYVASIAFRVAGLFIRMTFRVAFIIGLVAVVLLFLAARYPATFAFLK